MAATAKALCERLNFRSASAQMAKIARARQELEGRCEGGWLGAKLLPDAAELRAQLIQRQRYFVAVGREDIAPDRLWPAGDPRGASERRARRRLGSRPAHGGQKSARQELRYMARPGHRSVVLTRGKVHDLRAQSPHQRFDSGHRFGRAAFGTEDPAAPFEEIGARLIDAPERMKEKTIQDFLFILRGYLDNQPRLSQIEVQCSAR